MSNLWDMSLKKTFSLALAALAVAGVLGAPAGAAGGMKTLGTDPAGDGPPALDLTALHAGRVGDDLQIHIGVANMLPVIGGYPQLPGIQWAFDVKGRTFVAEAYVDTRVPAFLLFEVKGDAFEQIADLEGTYANDIIEMNVPLKLIGAKSGTKIVGAGENDVDAHVHAGPQTYIADVLTTSKALVLP